MASKHSCNNTVIFEKFLVQEVDVQYITSLKEANIKVNARLPEMILIKYKKTLSFYCTSEFLEEMKGAGLMDLINFISHRSNDKWMTICLRLLILSREKNTNEKPRWDLLQCHKEHANSSGLWMFTSSDSLGCVS